MCKWTAEYWKDFVEKVQIAAMEALPRVIAVAGDLKKGHDSGGYFGLRLFGKGEYRTSFLSEPILIGKVDPDCEAWIIRTCLEKNNRLEVKYFTDGHLSSYQSRNSENLEWGGAIVGCDGEYRYGFSFSGLITEHCDEAISLLVAMKVGCLTNDEAIHIANISSNTVFLRCLTKIKEPTSQEVSDNSEHQQLDDEWWGGR